MLLSCVIVVVVRALNDILSNELIGQVLTKTMMGSHPKLYSYQNALPTLPVPKLSKTITRVSYSNVTEASSSVQLKHIQLIIIHVYCIEKLNSI